MWWYLDQSLGVERWSIQISQIRVRTLLCCKTTPNELWCWRRLLRVPWTSRRSSQSILKEINPEYSLEGLMLKLQYFSHLMQRAGSLKKTLILEKIEGKSKRGQQRVRWLDSITNLKDMSLSKLWEMVKDREARHAVVHGVAKRWTWPNNWTTTTTNVQDRIKPIWTVSPPEKEASTCKWRRKKVLIKGNTGPL